jgi:hypothetical protein
MDTAKHIERLGANAEVIRRLLAAVGAQQASWRPAPERWTLLEIVNHLVDEEREDFRARLDVLLHHPDRPWPPIDPMNWVKDRAYAEREFAQSLQAFLSERDHSLRWLRTLAHPAWQAARKLQGGNTLRAGDLMVSWVAHDYFHIRQVTNLLWESLSVEGAPYSTEYAGPYR